jgi:hypothetical protein
MPCASLVDSHIATSLGPDEDRESMESGIAGGIKRVKITGYGSVTGDDENAAGNVGIKAYDTAHTDEIIVYCSLVENRSFSASST